MVDLTGQLAIVTGGARDIGRAICLQLARCGAQVAFCYRESEAAAAETLAALRQTGAAALAVQADVTRPADIARFLAAAHSAFPAPIDILVNNAGGLLARRKMDEMDEAFWDAVMAVNLKSTFLVTQSVLPRMRDGGAIVNQASQAARDGGGPGAIAYATSKGALLSFTRGLAKELGPRRIRVNAVCAGMIATRFHDDFTPPETRRRVAAAVPLGREGQAGEVAALTAFLAGSAAAYINGACLDINGGLLFS
ncbi:MAG TPA: glucose 1-dehydrogenase [Terriglobales bacterium]|nr:glucose 1-dehydrogenase [Terriglobales bacterium]